MDYGDGIQLNFDASMINNDNDDDLYSEPECDDTDHDSDSATTSFSDNLNDDFDAEDDDNDDAATDANDDHEMSQLHKPDDELTLMIAQNMTDQDADELRNMPPTFDPPVIETSYRYATRWKVSHGKDNRDDHADQRKCDGADGDKAT